MNRRRVLVTNDDGVRSPGLHALAAMAEHGAKPPLHDPALGFHYLEGLGLGFALLLLLILLLARSRFLRAASVPSVLP